MKAETDSVTKILLRDATDGVTLASVDGNEGTDVKTSYVDITPGHVLVAIAQVTTASATSGATTDIKKILFYFRVI